MTKELPRVTGILAAAGLVDYSGPWFSEEAKAYGKTMHRCCELIDKGALDWDSVDPRLLDSVKAYDAWRNTVGFVATFVEERLESKLGFCGTPDAFGVVGPLGGPAYLVIDRKRGIADAAAGIQLAGYVLLLCEHLTLTRRQIRRFALHRMGTGVPTVKEYTDPTDYDCFMGALAVTNWKENHGSRKRGCDSDSLVEVR